MFYWVIKTLGLASWLYTPIKHSYLFIKHYFNQKCLRHLLFSFFCTQYYSKSPRGVLPYMGHIGMCCCEGYGFKAVYSSIRYINQSVWVWNRLSFFTKLTSWLKILSRLRKPGIATQKYKQMKSLSLNFHDSASTALIHDYHKALLDTINCQKSEFRSDLGSWL